MILTLRRQLPTNGNPGKSLGASNMNDCDQEIAREAILEQVTHGGNVESGPD